MSMTAEQEATSALSPKAALAGLLRGYSAEVTARDKKGIEAAPELMPKGAEIFIAAIPGEEPARIIAAATQLSRTGLTVMPHVVARNIPSKAALDDLLARLAGEAGVNRAHVVGGDRDKPEGEYDASLQLLQTGLFQKHGINTVTIACYPEGHPRISDAVLEQALKDKLKVCAEGGLDASLVSQFAFDAEPIVGLARRLRAWGISAGLRAGVVGPADRTALIKFGLMCGVGASLRALKERHELARSVMSGETPEALLTQVALAQNAEPSLGIIGVHFFTFGALGKSTRFVDEHSG
jgi:methylenetetrahydrofolate reductase (NADPH)